MKSLIYLSIESPATLTFFLTTIAPFEMIAISVVPPPISTTICPFGSPTFKPDPTAAA